MLTRLFWQARKVLDTPAPRVHLWNSRAESHPVGAEFIIMDKVEGVPLSQVWGTMKLPQKLQVLLAMTRFQKQWLSVSFSHYGSLYYTGDVQPLVGNQYVKDGKAVKDSEFVIGPATGRDWVDAGRSILDVEKGPCTSQLRIIFVQPADQFAGASITHFLQAVGTREMKAIQTLKPPKQIALFCGPKFYRPDTQKKMTALAWYRQIVDVLIPKSTVLTPLASGIMIYTMTTSS